MDTQYFKPSYAKAEVRRPPLIMPDLWKKINIMAVMKGITAQELLNIIVTEYLEKTNIQELL